jgi:hypothetical protein
MGILRARCSGSFAFACCSKRFIRRSKRVVRRGESVISHCKSVICRQIRAYRLVIERDAICSSRASPCVARAPLVPRKASLAIEIGAFAQEKVSLGVDGASFVATRASFVVQRSGFSSRGAVRRLEEASLRRGRAVSAREKGALEDEPRCSHRLGRDGRHLASRGTTLFRRRRSPAFPAQRAEREISRTSGTASRGRPLARPGPRSPCASSVVLTPSSRGEAPRFCLFSKNRHRGGSKLGSRCPNGRLRRAHGLARRQLDRRSLRHPGCTRR